MRSIAYMVASVAMCLSLTACRPDYVKRYDTPLTYAEAITNKDIDFSLPSTSHDIYCAMYGDWQDYWRIVRFEAPVKDCTNEIEVVIAWDDKIYHRTSSYPRVTVTNVAPQSVGSLGSASWFTPDTITHGLYIGEDSSHTPQIWVDLDRGVFYFLEHD